MPPASNYTDEQDTPFKSIAVRIFLTLSLFYLYSGIYQLFPIPGWVDAGIYLGYGLNLPEMVHRYGFTWNAYQGTRLGSVFPLSIFYQLFEPLTAQFIKVGFLYVIAIFGTIAIGWRRSEYIAILAATFLAFNPLFVSAITFGGVDGFVIAYETLLATCLFSSSGIRNGKPELFLAGCFAALSFTSHPFSMIGIVALFLGHFYLTGAFKNTFLVNWFWSFIGFVSVLFILAVIGKFIGYDFFFLRPSFDMAKGSFLSGFGVNYRLDLKDWIFGASRVLVPILIFTWIICLKLVDANDRNQKQINTALIILGVAFFTYMFWDFFIGGVTIQTRSYFDMLLPALIMAVILVADTLPRTSNSFYITSIILIGLPSILLGIAGDSMWAFLESSRMREIFIVLLVCGIAVPVVLCFNNRYFKNLGSLGFVTTLILCSVAFAVNQDSKKTYKNYTNLDYSEAYLGMCQLSRKLETSGIAELEPKFLFSRKSLNNRLGDKGIYQIRFGNNQLDLNYYDSLVSLYLWNQSLLFAEPDDVPHPDLLPHKLPLPLVVLGKDDTEVQSIINKLKQRGYNISKQRSFSYTEHQFGWYASVLELNK